MVSYEKEYRSPRLSVNMVTSFSTLYNMMTIEDCLRRLSKWAVTFFLNNSEGRQAIESKVIKWSKNHEWENCEDSSVHVNPFGKGNYKRESTRKKTSDNKRIRKDNASHSQVKDEKPSRYIYIYIFFSSFAIPSISISLSPLIVSSIQV